MWSERRSVPEAEPTEETELDGVSSDPQATAEFTRVAPDLPAVQERLGDHLPGLEPERQVTDWGRSERLEGLVDRVLLDPLYRYWFRAEVEGVENLPGRGGALLVANHSGAVPCDAVMVAKAVREEHPLARAVHMSTDGTFAGVPGLGMMLSKLGGVADHPANLHRLLLDERALVLTFPEGRPAARKAVGRRYVLRSFAPEFVELAGGSQTPIVPVAVLGAEEAAPVFAGLGLPRLARRLPVSTPLPLPAKFRVRFLEPVEVDAADLEPGEPTRLAGEIRALIQENLLEMVGARRSVWLG